jgi:hypothetical protein
MDYQHTQTGAEWTTQYKTRYNRVNFQEMPNIWYSGKPRLPALILVRLVHQLLRLKTLL